jgi:hypothetical protein
MNVKFIFITLFTLTLCFKCFNSWAGMPIDYSCKIKKGTYDAVTIKKQNNNVLHIALRLDNKTCNVQSKNPMVMYWTLEDKAQSGVVPCQAVSSYEYRLMGLDPSNATRISSNQVSIHYPKIAEIAQDFNHIAEEFFEVESFSTSNGCKLDTTFQIDAQNVLFDQIKINMSVFSIKGIDLLLKGNLIYSL